MHVILYVILWKDKVVVIQPDDGRAPGAADDAKEKHGEANPAPPGDRRSLGVLFHSAVSAPLELINM